MEPVKRERGKVKWFDGNKGFGFVELQSGKQDAFLHIKQLLAAGYSSVIPEEPLEMEVRKTSRGFMAVNPKRLILEEEEVKKLVRVLQIAQGSEFKLLLVGRAGVGKSGTVNTLLGEKVAVEGAYEATTMGVRDYRCKVNGVPCVIYDTPGLSDGRPEEGRDEDYIAQIKKAVPDCDCLLYFSVLTDNRVRGDELRALDMITQSLGKEIWDQSVLVFTMADRAHSCREYQDFFRERSQLLRREISRITASNVGRSVPVTAVTNRGPVTPDGNPWLVPIQA